jgi:hypothetical protein
MRRKWAARAAAAMKLSLSTAVVRELDSQLALYDIRTIESAMDSLLSTERLVAVLGPPGDAAGFFFRSVSSPQIRRLADRALS